MGDNCISYQDYVVVEVVVQIVVCCVLWCFILLLGEGIDYDMMFCFNWFVDIIEDYEIKVVVIVMYELQSYKYYMCCEYVDVRLWCWDINFLCLLGVVEYLLCYWEVYFFVQYVM